MKNTNQQPKVSRFKILSLLLAFLTLFISGTELSFCVPSTQIKSGLVGPKSIVLDEGNNHLYYTEYTPGNVCRIDLNDPAHPVTTITSGLAGPECLALDLDHGRAYVTTRLDGSLWRVELSSGIQTRITFNMKSPMQLVLNEAKTHGYTVDFIEGRLRRIDLTTGVKKAIYKGLTKPAGIAVTKDEKFAYVSQQGPPGEIIKIDLTMGTLVESVTSSFSSPPFYLSWADTGQTALYVSERGTPSQRNISRVDLATNTKNIAVPGSDLPGQPYGTAIRGMGTPLFVSMTGQIREYDLLDLSGPVFMAVGHVPSSAITTEGYADTVNLMPGYFYQVEHCPFGGKVNIFGNFTNFLASVPGAVYYAVIKTKGATSTPLSHTWVVSRWDSTVNKYKPFTMAPALDGYKYEIPVESDGKYHADLWWYPFWIMRWPSGENGAHSFQIKLFDSTGSELPLPAAFAGLNNLPLMVDNTLPLANIDEIRQKNPLNATTLIEPCDIVVNPKNEFFFKLTAYDNNGHLLRYRLTALWGNNKSELISHDSYAAHPGVPPGYSWLGIFKEKVLESSPWSASCNCAYTFYLHVVKRTINGYNYILWRDWHKSITINFSSLAKCN